VDAINQLTDSELLQKVAGFEFEAVEEIYDRYSPLMFTSIVKIVNNQKLAEEILTEVFLIFANKIEKFDFKTNNVYSWLLTLARNKAVDVLRRQRNPESVEEYTDEYEDKYILPRLAEGISPMNLDEVLNDKERIIAAIDNMTDAQKYVLELAYYEGLTEKEIAKKLNIPFQTVRSKIQIALGNLKDKLK
jgi:RNA polymerase sigma-70 factor, ECF subfamily